MIEALEEDLAATDHVSSVRRNHNNRIAAGIDSDNTPSG